MPAVGPMCRRCLLSAGMPLWLMPAHLPEALLPITLDDDGVCNVCRSFARHRDPAAWRDDVEQCAFEVAAVEVLVGHCEPADALTELRCKAPDLVTIIRAMAAPGRGGLTGSDR